MTSSKKPSVPLHLGGFRGRLVQCSELTRGRRYDDIRMACVTQLVPALRNDTGDKTAWVKVCEIIDAHFKGDIRHVTDTLSLLWRTANQDDEITATSDRIPAVRSLPLHPSVMANPDLLDSLHPSTTPGVGTPSRPQW